MRMRKKRRGAERMTTLSALFVTKEDLTGDNADSLFSEDAPLCIEIGCGKGDYICNLSKRDSEYNYIAMEKVHDVAVVAAEKYASTRNLGTMTPHGEWETPDGEIYNGKRWDIPVDKRGNVRFFVEDASCIDELFKENSIDKIYANFSDPWPKKGYESRRLTHPEFLKRYLKLLKKGGTFAFKTDNADLFEFSVESIAGESGFEVTYVTRDLHKSDRAANNIMTEYEKNFSSQGININFIEAKKI